MVADAWFRTPPMTPAEKSALRRTLFVNDKDYIFYDAAYSYAMQIMHVVPISAKASPAQKIFTGSSQYIIVGTGKVDPSNIGGFKVLQSGPGTAFNIIQWLHNQTTGTQKSASQFI